MNWAKVLCQASVVAALALVLPNSARAAVNELVNPNFAEGATGWTIVGSTLAADGYNNHPIVAQGADYFNGGQCGSDATAEPVVMYGTNTQIANVFGPFFANPSTAAWTQQGIYAAPASTWTASGWTYASHEDLSGPNQFYYEVDFYNSAGTLIAAWESFVVQNLTCSETTPFPVDTWVNLAVTNQMQVTGGVNTGTVIPHYGPPITVITAPSATASVAFKANFVNINYAGGSIYLSDCALNLVSGASPPVISPIAVRGITLCTNTSVAITNTAASGATISEVQITITTSTLGSAPGTPVTTPYTTNNPPSVTGIGTGTAVITLPLTTNLMYTMSVVATDNGGLTGTANIIFDTLVPTLVIEASDFNYNGGSFKDTPANGGLALYQGLVGTEDIDEYKLLPGPQGPPVPVQSYYRPTGDVIIEGANPSTKTEQKFVTAAANGDTTDVEVEVGYNSIGDWLDYTRTYGPGGSAAAGNYNIWLYMTTDGTGTLSDLYKIAGDPTSESQTTTLLGQFGTASFSYSDNSWSAYEYVPLTDQFGNLVPVTLSGTQTLRSTVVGNPNLGFYLLVPSAQVVTPILQYEYPNGLHPFEPTNFLTFTVGHASGAASIASTGFDLVVNGVDVTSSPGFSVTGPSGTGSWIVNYAIQSNAVYAAVLNVTNRSGLFSTFPVSFDTFNPNNYQWEASDYDFSTNNGSVWISGLFIDNPVPTGDTTLTPATASVALFATNSYYGFPTGFTPGDDYLDGLGAVAQQGIDMNFAEGDGGMLANYRADDVGDSAADDYLRPKFLASQTTFSDPNIGPFAIGWFNGGDWLNYTRHYPTNNYYVWGRLAGGAPYGGTSGTAATALSIVTSGWGTATQTTNVLGTFSDPAGAGWLAWHWVPLLDANGNMVVVSLGGQATLKLTTGGNEDPEFFMLVPGPLSFTLTPSIVAGHLNISFPTETGYTYQVQYKSGLTVPTWTSVGSAITGDGAVQTVIESLSGTQGYYQVVATQQ